MSWEKHASTGKNTWQMSKNWCTAAANSDFFQISASIFPKEKLNLLVLLSFFSTQSRHDSCLKHSVTSCLALKQLHLRQKATQWGSFKTSNFAQSLHQALRLRALWARYWWLMKIRWCVSHVHTCKAYGTRRATDVLEKMIESLGSSGFLLQITPNLCAAIKTRKNYRI